MSYRSRCHFAEKSGLIKVFANISATIPTVFHDLRTNVHAFWDRGLLGLALHPNFPTVPSVYVLYAHDKDPNNPQVPRWGTPGTTSDGCPTPIIISKSYRWPIFGGSGSIGSYLHISAPTASLA
jgi:hypothetical protein